MNHAVLKAPLRAVLYDGKNIDEVLEFGKGAFRMVVVYHHAETQGLVDGSTQMLGTEYGNVLSPGTWIVDIGDMYIAVGMDREKDQKTRFLLMSDEQFHKYWEIRERDE